MVRPLASAKTLARMRTSILQLLPQYCQVHPHTRTITSSGSYDEVVGAALDYNGTTQIPCRLDASRYPRFGAVMGQELVVSEFELHVPFDAPLHADHRILINEEWFEVRKIADVEPHRATKYALVDRLDVGKAEL